MESRRSRFPYIRSIASASWLSEPGSTTIPLLLFSTNSATNPHTPAMTGRPHAKNSKIFVGNTFSNTSSFLSKTRHTSDALIIFGISFRGRSPQKSTLPIADDAAKFWSSSRSAPSPTTRNRTLVQRSWRLAAAFRTVCTPWAFPTVPI